MNNTMFSFILTILAGFSTMIGLLAVFINNKKKDRIILSALAFASGVMVTVSITDLIPESIFLLANNMSQIGTILLCLLGIIFGVVISMIIDYYLPDSPINISKDKSLFRVGIISMIAIILHNIPEDCIYYVS